MRGSNNEVGIMCPTPGPGWNRVKLSTKIGGGPPVPPISYGPAVTLQVAGNQFLSNYHPNPPASFFVFAK